MSDRRTRDKSGVPSERQPPKSTTEVESGRRGHYYNYKETDFTLLPVIHGRVVSGSVTGTSDRKKSSQFLEVSYSNVPRHTSVENLDLRSSVDH